MASIEPYSFREKTNLQEHNDIINKVNEIVDVINDTDLDNIGTRLTNDESQIAVNTTAIKANTTGIDGLIDSVDTIDKTLDTIEPMVSNHETDIANLKVAERRLSNDVVSTYTFYRNGEGKIKAQMETVGGTLIDSNTLDMIIPYQYDIISGTTDRSFKLNITMSDGSSYTTNDFVIPDGGGSEIVVTGITLSKDSSNVNRFHVGINLSDSTMIDSGYITMVDNVVATYADSKLTISVNGVSSVPVAIDVSGEFTPGTGITITSGTIAIDDTVVALKSDIADMETKTNASATYATKTALASTDKAVSECATGISTNRNLINPCYDDVSISSNVLTFTTVDGSTKNITIPSSGGGSEKTVITITDMDTLLSTVKLGDILVVPMNLSARSDYTSCGIYGRIFTPSPITSDYYCVVNFVGVVTTIPDASLPNKYVIADGYGRYYNYDSDAPTTNSENTIQELVIWRNVQPDFFAVNIAQSKADANQVAGYLDNLNIKLIR